MIILLEDCQLLQEFLLRCSLFRLYSEFLMLLDMPSRGPAQRILHSPRTEFSTFTSLLCTIRQTKSIVKLHEHVLN